MEIATSVFRFVDSSFFFFQKHWNGDRGSPLVFPLRPKHSWTRRAKPAAKAESRSRGMSLMLEVDESEGKLKAATWKWATRAGARKKKNEALPFAEINTCLYFPPVGFKGNRFHYRTYFLFSQGT